MLIVDDELPVRRALRRELAPEYDVLEAEGPHQALALIASRAGEIAAVVSDLNMEGGPDAGERLLEEVARVLPGCTRVLVSGSLAAQLGQLSCADATVAKPWQMGAVLILLRRLLAR